MTWWLDSLNSICLSTRNVSNASHTFNCHVFSRFIWQFNFPGGLVTTFQRILILRLLTGVNSETREISVIMKIKDISSGRMCLSRGKTQFVKNNLSLTFSKNHWLYYRDPSINQLHTLISIDKVGSVSRNCCLKEIFNKLVIFYKSSAIAVNDDMQTRFF